MNRFVQYLILISIALSIGSCEKNEGEIINEVENSLIEQLNSNKRSHFDYSFLHISDTHGSSYTASFLVGLLSRSEASFGVITGDIVPINDLLDVIHSSSKPIFLLPGNHDCYDNLSQKWFRENILNISPWLSMMNFGDVNSNYYYVDFENKGKRNRLICLDQYELDAVGIECAYNIVISQQQVSWFIECLKSADKYDSIIIAMHCGFGNSGKGARDFFHKNKFITETGGNPESYEYSGKSDPRMIPDIVEAYKSGVNINKYYFTGFEDSIIQVETDFEGAHSNFVLFFGGHTHWDVTENLSYYPDLLQSIISSANYVCSSSYDDVVRESSGINAITINDHFVDLSEREIQIVRLGARKLKNGGIRDEITFDF